MRARTVRRPIARHAIELALLLIGCRALAGAAPPPSPPTVADLLRSLSATGVEVLYSSALVPPDLVAPMPLQAADLLSQVREVLAANGLQLKQVDDRRYIVTRTAPPHDRRTDTLGVQAASVASPLSALEEIVVFASHYTFKSDALGESSAFDHGDIERVAGTQNDALRATRAAPGVASTYSSRPYLRGGSADDVLFRFDGIVLANPFHFREFQSLLSPFTPSAVDRIDVYSGGFPVRFGTRAAGVIDVTPRTVPSGYDLRANVSRLGVDVAGAGHPDRWPVDWLLTARRSTDGTNVLEPVDARPREPTFLDALGRVRWQVSPTSSAILGWLVLDDQAHARADDTNQAATARSRDEYVWLAWNWAPSSALQSQTSLTYTASENGHFGRLQLSGIADGTLDEEHDFSSLALRTEWVYAPSASLVLNFGSELSSEHAALDYDQQETFALVLVPGLAPQTTVAMSSTLAPRSTTSAVFASARRHWQAFEAEFGLRLDRQDYQGFGARTQGVPRLTMRYDPAPDWHLYASWGAFSQAQRIDEYRNEEGQSSPDSASRATHTVLGLSQERAGTVHWRAEVYRNHWSSLSPYYDNRLGLVSLLPELQPDRIRVAPSGAQSDGVELSARRPFGAHLEVWGTYTIARAFDELVGSTVPRSWDQRQAANLGVAWARSRTTASLLVGWHSGWPRTALSALASTPTSQPALVLGPRNALRWGDYLSVDAHVSHSIGVPFGELSVWMEVSNATNRANDCCSDLAPVGPPVALPQWSTDPWAERRVNVGFSWHLKKRHQ